MGLAPGLEHAFDFTVEGDLLTDVGGTIPTPVLATPRMIGLMERCAVLAVAEHYPEGKASVGFEVCVRHVAAAFEGTRCTVRARLTEVADGRKLRFEVEVTSSSRRAPSEVGPDETEYRIVGTGTHERRLVGGD